MHLIILFIYKKAANGMLTEQIALSIAKHSRTKN